MNESIVDYLNGLLDLIGYFDKRYCLTELKSEGDNVYPVHYLANGDWQKITIDQNHGTTYWRKGDISSSKIQNDLTTDILYQWTIPYRLVAYKKRGDVGTDNEYTADRLADVLTKQLTFVNGALRNTLNARKVEVTVTQRSTDSAAIYAEEYNPAPAKDIPFKYVVVALDVEVIVDGRRDCMDICPTDNDILHSFDFCKDSTFNRLTIAQKACLTTELCGAADPATLEINGVEITTIASGATREQQVHDVVGNDVGSNSSGEWVVGDGVITVNGDAYETVRPEGSTDVIVEYVNGTPVGSIVGNVVEIPDPVALPSVAVSVDDSSPNLGDTITITATPTNITPTGYIFFALQGSSITFIAQQASASFDWTVTLIGSMSIFVMTDDGTNTAYNQGGEAVTSTGFLLDTYPDAVGYSFMCLRALYTGGLVRLRRSSDNAESDFYPDATNKISMTSEDGAGTSLATWVGANSAYLVTWYDQGTGADDATQTTASKQPRVVNAGTLVTQNGIAAMEFDGADDEIEFAGLTGHARVDAYYVQYSADTKYIAQYSSNAAYYGLVCQNASASGTIYSVYGSPSFYVNAALQSWASRDAVHTTLDNAQKLVVHQDTVTTLWPKYNFGYYAGSFAFVGKLQEYVAYPSDQSANRAGIESNINTRFTIY